MSTLDLLPQPMARRTDAQTKTSASAANSGKSGHAAEADAFGTVLQGVSGGNGAGGKHEGAAATRLEADEAAALNASTSSGTDDAMGDLLQAIAQEPAGAGPQASQGSPAYSLLEGLLPRMLGQSNPGQKTGGSGAPGSGMLLPGMGTGQEVLLNSASSPTVRVSVQHQETHFSPVIDGLTTKVIGAESGAPADEIALEEKSLPLGILKDAAKRSDAAAGSASMLASSQATTAVVVSRQVESEETAILKGSAMDRQLSKLESAGPMADAGPKSDAPSSLAPAMLQRIAGAVLSEVQQMRTEAKIHPHQMDNAHFLTTAKASEGAARLLSIQLHPADLGLITVKMRLSGDSLEMEIQVSSEETAQLLRNDAEKLSGLLKGSGYRPDMITIQNGPAASAQTDGSQSQRQQSMSQSQQEAFERGAQQQGGGSQQREQPYESERKGGRHDASGESNPNNRSVGGVYL